MKLGKVFLVSAVCLSIAFSGCAPKTEEIEETEGGISVLTVKAEKGDIETEYVYSGKIAPVEERDVYSTVQGKVAAVNFDIGDSVNAGDVLFKMDTESLVLNRNQIAASISAADANIASAQLSVDTVDGASYQMNVENLKLNMDLAEQSYENAKTTYENNKVLYENGIISKADMDSTELAYTQAKNNYESAKTSYEMTTGELLAENKEKAQAALNSAVASKESLTAQLQTVEKSIRDSSVTSPISGVVTACNVREGELLSSASVPFTITDTSKVKIDVDVSQRIINSVKAGDKVSVRTEAADIIEGTVKTVNPAANTSGTYAVEIEIENKDGLFKPGMFAEVTFVNEKGDTEIVIDRDAVISKEGETYVFVDDNGTAVKKIVETGIDDGTSIQILSGINEGDMVVVKGQTYLSEGDILNVIDDTAAAKTETENSQETSASSEKEE